MSKLIEITPNDINKISIVCPFYNEEGIIESAIKSFLERG